MIENIVKGQKIASHSNIYEQTTIYTFQKKATISMKNPAMFFYKYSKWIFRPPRIFNHAFFSIFHITYAV